MRISTRGGLLLQDEQPLQYTRWVGTVTYRPRSGPGQVQAAGGLLQPNTERPGYVLQYFQCGLSFAFESLGAGRGVAAGPAIPAAVLAKLGRRGSLVA
jgi:hypothetical protein